MDPSVAAIIAGSVAALVSGSIAAAASLLSARQSHASRLEMAREDQRRSVSAAVFHSRKAALEKTWVLLTKLGAGDHPSRIEEDEILAHTMWLPSHIRSKTISVLSDQENRESIDSLVSDVLQYIASIEGE